MLTFSPANDFDRFAFEQLLLEAAQSARPTEIGHIEFDPELIPLWLEEGRMRTAVNRSIGTAHPDQAKQQRIEGQAWTCDELGRVCEGPVELMLGLDVAAVNTCGTEPSADKSIQGVRFDVKGAGPERNGTFSLPVWTTRCGRYDALVLVHYLRPGLCRVFACKCAPDEGCWQLRPGTAGRKPFYLINTASQ